MNFLTNVPMCYNRITLGTFCMEQFFKNAHFFLEHADEILADERMYLIPIPVDNTLGYVLGGGLKKPTLGTYIEWWQTEEKAKLHLPDGSVELIYQLTGSLLSGCNCCRCVDRNGTTREVNVSDFTGLCKCLVAVNRKYQIVVDVALLTLEEVVTRLRSQQFP